MHEMESTLTVILAADATRVRAVHYYALAHAHPSGVTAAIDAWAEHLAPTVQSKIVGTDATQSVAYTCPSQSIRHWGSSRRTLVPDVLALSRLLRSADVLVLHEGWTLSHLIAAVTARAVRRPYILMPHGVYDPQVVDGIKDIFGLRRRAEKRLIRGARVTHLFFESEVPQVEIISGVVPVVVAPTGLPEQTRRRREERPGGPLLWFGRMDVHHKGLDIIIKGLAAIAPDERPLLRVFGYDYQGGYGKLVTLIEEHGLGNQVTVGGYLDPIGKQRELSQAAAYVHPSRWECHSIAVLEVLASGVPVLIGSGAHVAPFLAAVGAAKAVAPTPDSWALALRELPPSPSAKALAEVEEEFSWERVTEVAVKAYLPVTSCGDPQPRLARLSRIFTRLGRGGPGCK